LIDSAAARQREDVNDEPGDDQAGHGRCQQKPRRRERISRSQQIEAAPVNGETEADPREPGENTDEDRKDEEETFLAENRAQAFAGSALGHQGDGLGREQSFGLSLLEISTLSFLRAVSRSAIVPNRFRSDGHR